MKNLRKQLQDYLKSYVVDAEHFDIEDFKVNHPTALDIELTQTLLLRETLEENKNQFSSDERKLLNEADMKFLQLWEKVRSLETNNPHVKLAIGVLSDLVSVITSSQRQPTRTTA
jgi:hypothetical protein